MSRHCGDGPAEGDRKLRALSREAAATRATLRESERWCRMTSTRHVFRRSCYTAFQGGIKSPIEGGTDAHFLQKVSGCTNRSVPRHLRDTRPCSGAKIQGGLCKDARWS